MKEKDNYTKNEIEKMLRTYCGYLIKKIELNELNVENYELKKFLLNQDVEECNKVIPKSLIDKLGIKKSNNSRILREYTLDTI